MYFVIYNPNADNTYSNIWFPIKKDVKQKKKQVKDRHCPIEDSKKDA